MKKNISIIAQKSARVLLYSFAGIGFLFASVYAAMHFHLTDVKGSIDSRNSYFSEVTKNAKINASLLNAQAYQSDAGLDAVTTCQLVTISSVLPRNGKMIFDAYKSTNSPEVVKKMIGALLLVTKSNTFLQDKIHTCDTYENTSGSSSTPSNQTIFDWALSLEWESLRAALVKDKDSILLASKDSGVPARMIVSTVIAEQFRFFTSNRESFKRYFEPLKILGNGTKFSYGVAGVKLETAQQIEVYLKNQNSKFYLGPEFEKLLDYKTEDPDSERLVRLTDNKNHYFSYLYTGLFLKQIIYQWAQEGYDIHDRPEVLATLFNLGYMKSIPKANPEVGGSTIIINDREYTFGGLSYEFYYSGELSDLFPL